MNRTLQHALLASAFLMGVSVAAQAPQTDTPKPTAPDNTEKNKRDRADGAKTPMDQGNNATDLQLTKQIRSEITDSKGLSVNARNIKIISVNGKVTLRGPVANQEEKDLIDSIAKRIAGADNVVNRLEVKGAK